MNEGVFQGLIQEAAEEVSSLNWASFAISTQLPDNWMIEEELEFDRMLDKKSESVKNRINSLIIREIAKTTKAKYDPINADGRIIFDFSASKLSVEFEPLFVFGRYKKLEAGLSQSRWVCRKCEGDGCFKCDWKGRYYVSVEELVGEVFKQESEARDYSMHASGREDVDVVNVAGRPFVLEIIKPKNRKINPGLIKDKINADKKVSVSDLRFVSRAFVEVVTESHFEKEYEVEIEFEKEIADAQVQKILALGGKTINQRTPKRVAHRRADLERKRKVISIIFLGSEGNRAGFRILAEAGTYIKELITGDKGRTEPSFSGILGVPAKCVGLKVVRIYDDFLDVVMR